MIWTRETDLSELDPLISSTRRAFRPKGVKENSGSDSFFY